MFVMVRWIVVSAVLAVMGTAAGAQQLSISSVSISRLGKQNLCSALGGGGSPPAITVRHSKAAGTISISMIDRLSDGRTIDHGNTSVPANPSGVTSTSYAFLPPCNRRTGEGLRSAYYVTASAGNSAKTVLWGRYP